jgi:DNA-binding CsgD family transcriptional regulator
LETLLLTSAGPGTDLTGSTLELVISSLGTAHFGRSLFGALRDDLACDQVTAFAFSAQTQPRIVATGDPSDEQLSSVLARKYVSGYWRADPAFTFMIGLEQAPDMALISISSVDIPDRDYRARFYDRNGITSRLTVAQRDATGLWISNLYRGPDRPPFAAADLARLSQRGRLIQSLTRKHDELVRDRSGLSDLKSMQERLAAPPFGLSPRESDVCARIIHGLTSEGIALDLGISTNSVLTHRKNAYRRLNISCQN